MIGPRIKRIAVEIKIDCIAVGRVFLLPVALLAIAILITAWWLGEAIFGAVKWIIRSTPAGIQFIFTCCKPKHLFKAVKVILSITIAVPLLAVLAVILVVAAWVLYIILPFLVPALLLVYLAHRVRLFMSPQINLEKPPGATLMRVADFMFSPTTVEHVFTQLVADWRAEYFAALESKRLMKARWISMRYWWAFAKAFGLTNAVPMLKGLIKR